MKEATKEKPRPIKSGNAERKAELKTGINYALIKRWLTKTDIKELGEEFGFVRGHVYNILGGRSNNIKFLQRAIDRAVENKMRTVEGLKGLIKLQED